LIRHSQKIGIFQKLLIAQTLRGDVPLRCDEVEQECIGEVVVYVSVKTNKYYK
jgi:hypothetical protein